MSREQVWRMEIPGKLNFGVNETEYLPRPPQKKTHGGQPCFGRPLFVSHEVCEITTYYNIPWVNWMSPNKVQLQMSSDFTDFTD